MVIIISTYEIDSELLGRTVSKPDGNLIAEGSDFKVIELSPKFLKADKDIVHQCLADHYPEELVIVSVGAKVTKYLTDKKIMVSAVKNLYQTSYPAELGEGTYKVLPALEPNTEPNIISFLDRVDAAIGMQNGVPFEKVNVPHEIVETPERVREVLQMAAQTGVCSWDFETRSTLEDPSDRSLLHWWCSDVKPSLLSISVQPGYSFIIPMEHPDSVFKDGGYLWILAEFYREVLLNLDILKVGHNLKYDFHIIFSELDLDVTEDEMFRGKLDDSILMAHLIDENWRKGLKPLTKKFIPKFSGYDEGMDYQNDSLVELAEYAAIDTNNSLLLSIHFEAILMGDWRLYQYYHNMTVGLSRVLFKAEHRGVKIDYELLSNTIDECELALEVKEQELRDNETVVKFSKFKEKETLKSAISEVEKKMEGVDKYLKDGETISKRWTACNDKLLKLKSGHIDKYEINFNSPAQMAELLYGKEGFNYPKSLDDRGNLTTSTGVDALSYIASDFTQKLLVFRSLKKLQTTYFKGIYDLCDVNGIIHTSFNQNGTKTGRISASKPNLLNITSRVKFDDEIYGSFIKILKKLFVPLHPDAVSVQVDYSQAELRVAGSIAEEDTMIAAYLEGKDLHRITAASSMGISYEEFLKLDSEVQAKNRQDAKGTNFGTIYDISADGLKSYLWNAFKVKVSKAQAGEMIALFFKTYPKLTDWHELYKSKVKKFGYVRTLFGRKRHLPDIYSQSFAERKKAERLAINNPVQGTATEYLLFSMVLLDYRYPKGKAFMWSTVYDSIMVEVQKEYVEEFWEVTQETTENISYAVKYFDINEKKTKIPMKVDFSIGETWGHQEEFLSYEQYIL